MFGGGALGTTGAARLAVGSAAGVGLERAGPAHPASRTAASPVSMIVLCMPVGKPEDWSLARVQGPSGGQRDPAKIKLLARILDLDRVGVHNIVGVHLGRTGRQLLDVMQDNIGRTELDKHVVGEPQHGRIVQFAHQW